MPWYKNGLKFQCTGCGKCCTGSEGYIWVTLEEMEEIAQHLKMDLQSFAKKYVRKVGGRYSLKEKEHFDCVFLEGKRCTIYSVRPKQCRTYPFWEENLKSEEHWKRAANFCEGIAEEAPVVAFEKIEKVKHDPGK